MKTNFLTKSLLLVCIAALVMACKHEPAKTSPKATNIDDKAMDDWQKQKFSMFIHWGIYSIPAGIWDGKQISGYSEQIKGHAPISTDDYRKLAAEFNPTNWNADSVAILAKETGMKSIVITTKHHDGFCLFASEHTSFDVVDATPYKKDVIKELSNACQRHGLKFGVYFSIIDWDYHGASPFVSTHNSDTIPQLHHQYNLKQIEELLTNYGEISEFWFDMGAPSQEQSKEMATLVKKLQPNCLVSGRIWNDQGDFIVMGDNYQPKFKMGVPWQTPASMFHETWSYRSWQKRSSVDEKIKEKIEDLLNIVSAGGNYLLNIGPNADGTVIPFEKQVLHGMGKWMESNAEAIYASHKSPLAKQEWGYVTAKPGKLFLHITNYPENNQLIINGLLNKSLKAYPLSNNSLSLNTTTQSNQLLIELSDNIIKNEYATVIVLSYDGELDYTPPYSIESANDEYNLSFSNAEKYHSYSGHDYYSSKPTVVKMKWYLNKAVVKNSKISINLKSGHVNRQFQLSLNGEQKLLIKTDENGVSNFKSEKYFNLKKDQVNKVELSLFKPDNIHKGMLIDSLNIRLMQ